MFLFNNFVLWLFLFRHHSSANKETCGQLESDTEYFPWNVGIYIENINNFELVCFGSLIAKNTILTAAHCLCDNLNEEIRNNSFYITTEIDDKILTTNVHDRNLEKVLKKNIFIHPYYKGLTNGLSNDLAIIKAQDQLMQSKKAKTVCMDWSNTLEINANGKKSVWNGTAVIIVEGHEVDFEDCISEAPEKLRPFVRQDKYCTQHAGIKADRASEGAGIVVKNPEDSLWYLAGVISTYDFDKGQLSTYSRISQYINWISNIRARL